MSLYVFPSKLGSYSLYCYACGESVPNTANHEMAKEGVYAHSHHCYSPQPRKMAACPLDDGPTDCTAESKEPCVTDCLIFKGKCWKHKKGGM